MISAATSVAAKRAQVVNPLIPTLTPSLRKKPKTNATYLPPYSPDLNPIEMAFSKFKALLKKAAARTIDDLRTAIAQALPQLTPNDCANYFTAAGYGSV